MSPDRLPPPRLIRSILELTRRHPLERKLVVAPTKGAGRELLRRAALEGGRWIGFEVFTPRPLAAALAGRAMDQRHLSLLDEFDEQAYLDEALDGALLSLRKEGANRGPAEAALALDELQDGVGFRQAAHETVRALRLAGVSASHLRSAPVAGGVRRVLLARMLDRFEKLLARHRRVDVAGLFDLALEALEGDGRTLLDVFGEDTVVALLPGQSERGRSGAFLRRLREMGAGILPGDAVEGRQVPEHIVWAAGAPRTTLSWLGDPGAVPSELPDDVFPVRVACFHASSVTAELREVLRRIVTEGHAWDEVEIVTPDPAAYGSALHTLASTLGVPVTYAVGLPVERTRPGRVAAAFLEWVEEGYPAEIVRRLLEAGDLRPGESWAHHAPGDLARRFRRLRIGWGRNRTRARMRQALERVDAREDDAQHRRRARGELQALESILAPTLEALRPLPDRGGEASARVTPAEIAHALGAFLERVPAGDEVDEAAMGELRRILRRVAATLRRPTGFHQAITLLRQRLAVRVQAARSPTAGEEADPDAQGAPWRAEGGHLHITDIQHGGYAGRPVTFVVGMDADRIPGSVSPDPVLLDRERAALSRHLPTVRSRIREQAFEVARFFARLRGSVTMSYTSWKAGEARAASPSPILLQAVRIGEGRPGMTFKDLKEFMGPPVTPVSPGFPAALPLDAADAWLTALWNGSVLAGGLDAVAGAYPRLRAGLEASRARKPGAPPGPHQGVVEARRSLLDPRRNPEIVLSPSALEALGACPRRYFFRQVLGIRAVEDPELDPDRWLDPLRRGSLLHAVFEETHREAARSGISPDDSRFEAVAVGILEQEIAAARREVPSPGEGAVRREVRALTEDVRSFCMLARSRGADWMELEFAFGGGGRDPVPLALAGGELRLRGRIDRIVEDLEGLRIIDYKTGAAPRRTAKEGIFDGGRRLQVAVYAQVAEILFARPVRSGAYWYPTLRGRNEVMEFSGEELARVRPLLEILCDGVAEGHFVPTDKSNDCQFCDYGPICRVVRGEHRGLSSPLADWTKQWVTEKDRDQEESYEDVFRQLKEARTY
ncbi:MAG: PD-(D/E)XK nuclease family protein [Gemmatimonadota bacterium]